MEPDSPVNLESISENEQDLQFQPHLKERREAKLSDSPFAKAYRLVMANFGQKRAKLILENTPGYFVREVSGVPMLVIWDTQKNKPMEDPYKYLEQRYKPPQAMVNFISREGD